MIASLCYHSMDGCASYETRLWATSSRRKGCLLNSKPCSGLPRSFGSFKGCDLPVTRPLFFSFCASQTSFYSSLVSTCAMFRFLLLLFFFCHSLLISLSMYSSLGFQFYLQFLEAMNSTFMFALLNVQILVKTRSREALV